VRCDSTFRGDGEQDASFWQGRSSDGYMDFRVAVVVATKGRPHEVRCILSAIERQTLLPDSIIISACERTDVPELRFGDRVQVIFGPPGLPSQRNRACSLVKRTADVVVFFDDDFVPSRFWIERACKSLAAQPDIVSLTGRIIEDGAAGRGMSWAHGALLVDHADCTMDGRSDGSFLMKEGETPYGCNMALRTSILHDLMFDERLVLYGWLEDRDFGVRAASLGRTVWTDTVWGVHLGVKHGRESGGRYGYSQIVNPWYLMRKGTLGAHQAGRHIARALLSNAARSLQPKSTIDRRGRLKGNLIGLYQIMMGTWAPERAKEIDSGRESSLKG
jgi:GT2 family glycosyltransferase